MRFKLCRGRAGMPPRDPMAARAAPPPPKLADYDELVIQSAIISYVVGERSGGVDLATLAADLRCSLSGDHGRADIDRALAALSAERLVVVRGGRVYPGPVFGGASGTGIKPSSN